MMAMNGIIQRINRRISTWLARILPDCKRMTRKLGESLDRMPTLRERVIMELHLRTCDACRRYIEQVRFLKNAMRSHSDGGEEGDIASRRDPKALSRERITAVFRSKLLLAF